MNRNEIKSPQNKTWSFFSIGQLLLSMGLPWSAADIASDTPLGKTDFPSPSSCQLPREEWLGWDFVSTSPSQCWDSDRLEARKFLCV